MKILTTPGGIRFGISSDKPSHPKPTLLVAASNIAATLYEEGFNKCGRLLMKRDWLNVALDIPAHGADIRPGENIDSLESWRERLKQGENIVEQYTRQASEVLGYLIEEQYSDPNRIVIAGTSRGGFLALHVTAADSRVQKAVAFCPVTELIALREFRDMEKHELTRSLAVGNLAEKLVGKKIWMCIGNHDHRVSTDSAFAAMRKIAMANLDAGKPATIELHVQAAEGHGIDPHSHEDAATRLMKEE
jgi:dienelactone hydrolase